MGMVTLPVWDQAGVETGTSSFRQPQQLDKFMHTSVVIKKYSRSEIVFLEFFSVDDKIENHGPAGIPEV